MKKLLILLLFITSTLCFAQSDYQLTKNTGKGHSRATNIIKYDSVKNITLVKLYANITKKELVGKWFDFNDKEFREEHLVSHCPVFVDENDVILEVGLFSKNTHKSVFGSNFEQLAKKYLSKHTRKKSILISTKADPEKKMYVYKIKMPYRDDDQKFFTSYHLIGKKGNYIYRMVIYNIDETNYDNFDTFLINTFNSN